MSEPGAVTTGFFEIRADRTPKLIPMKPILLILLLLTLNHLAYAQTRDWASKIGKVKLLKTTYDDVLAAFGKPRDEGKDLIEIFPVKNGEVWVIFASGKCVEDKEDPKKLIGWNVPEWTVVDISYTPNKRFKPNKLGFDISTFEKRPIFDVPDAFIYSNEEKGISVTIDRKGEVETVSYYPSDPDKYLCDRN